MHRKIYIIMMSSLLVVGLVAVSLSAFFGAKKKAELENQVEEINLVIWGIFDESDVYRGLIEEYESKNRNINIKYYKIGNDVSEYENLLINEIAEGEGPDIFLIKNDWADKHIGKISPLEDNKKMNVDYLKDKFVTAVTEDMIRENKIYGIPLYIDSLAVYYNREMLERYVPSRGKPGRIWEEIEEDAIKITRSDNSPERFETSGIALGRSDNIARSEEILTLMLVQNDTRFYNQAGTGSILAQVQAANGLAPGVETLRFYTSFANPNYENYCWNESITRNSEAKEVAAFAKGKVAMIIGYSYLYEDIVDKINEYGANGENVINPVSIAVAPMPQTDKEDKINLASYFAYTVNKNSENKEEAWDFIAYMASPEKLKEYGRITNKPTPMINLIPDQAVDPIYGPFALQSKSARTFDLIDQDYFFSLLSEAIEKVVSGRSTPKDALQIVEDGLTEKMKQEREINNLNIL